MDIFVTIFKYFFLGFFGLVGFLVVYAILFGKRIKKEWEYEAEFHNDAGREFAELDIESSRIEKEEPYFSLKARFKMKHALLQPQVTVQVFIDDTLVMQGMPKEAGRIYLRQDDMTIDSLDVSAGQLCRIVIDGTEHFSQELVVD